MWTQAAVRGSARWQPSRVAASAGAVLVLVWFGVAGIGLSMPAGREICGQGQ